MRDFSPELAAQVDEYMRARVELEHFSGAIGIARAGEVLVSQGYGLANREHTVPNSPLTKFRLASVTKQFTATAIMLLQQQGKLRVQDAIRAHLADCPSTWDEVTIHPQIYESYAGEYSFTDDGRTITIAVRREGDRLIAQIAGDPAFELLPRSELEFFVEAFDDRFTFGVDPRGQATYIVMDMGGRIVRATRIRG